MAPPRSTRCTAHHLRGKHVIAEYVAEVLLMAGSKESVRKKHSGDRAAKTGLNRECTAERRGVRGCGWLKCQKPNTMRAFNKIGSHKLMQNEALVGTGCGTANSMPHSVRNHTSGVISEGEVPRNVALLCTACQTSHHMPVTLCATAMSISGTKHRVRTDDRRPLADRAVCIPRQLNPHLRRRETGQQQQQQQQQQRQHH